MPDEQNLEEELAEELEIEEELEVDGEEPTSTKVKRVRKTKLFDQDAVNKIVASRLSRAEASFVKELGDFESLEEAKEKISLVDTYQTLLVQQEVNTLFTSVSDKLVEGSEQDAKAYIRSLVSIGADGLQKPEKILDKFKEEKAYMLKPEKETLPNTPDRRKRDDKKVDYRLKI